LPEAITCFINDPNKWRAGVRKFNEKQNRVNARVEVRDQYSQDIRLKATRDITEDDDEFTALSKTSYIKFMTDLPVRARR